MVNVMVAVVAIAVIMQILLQVAVIDANVDTASVLHTDVNNNPTTTTTTTTSVSDDAADDDDVDSETTTPSSPIDAQQQQPHNDHHQFPNIILFLADNLGYGDVSWLQQQQQTTIAGTKAQTPHIDSIGANGMTFHNWNSVAHLCSASRAAILTGQYPARLGIYPGTFQPDAANGIQMVGDIPVSSTRTTATTTTTTPPVVKLQTADNHARSLLTMTLPSLLKKYSSSRSACHSSNTDPTTCHTQQQQQHDDDDDGQYVTAIIGKWHLGHTSSHLPTNHGFDTYLGIPYHMSGGSIDDHICTYDDDDDDDPHHRSMLQPPRRQWLPLYNNTNIVQQPVNVTILAQTYVTAAKAFIERHQREQGQRGTSRPFFLYMAFSHVHQLCASYTHVEQTSCQWSGGNRRRPPSSSSATFVDAVQEMDDMVGQILDTLQRESDTTTTSTTTANSRSNTLIVFTSDNGPWLAEQSCSGLRGPYHAQWLRDNVAQNCTACPHEYVSNPTDDNPRRCTLSQTTTTTISANACNGRQNYATDDTDADEIVLEMDGVHCGDDSGLGSIWEANLRMPAMIQWTGKIPPNTTTSALVSSLDITPTILALIFNGTTELQKLQGENSFDGQDVSAVWLGREHEYDSDARVLFFWRDGFLLNLAPLGPPYGRFDVVAVKVGRIKVWYWTKSAHYNSDIEVYHHPPLLFDTISDPAEALPIDYNYNDTSDKYTQLVQRVDHLVDKHKRDIASSLPYPLTLERDPKYIPCIDRTTGCRSTTPPHHSLFKQDGNVS